MEAGHIAGQVVCRIVAVGRVVARVTLILLDSRLIIHLRCLGYFRWVCAPGNLDRHIDLDSMDDGRTSYLAGVDHLVGHTVHLVVERYSLGVVVDDHTGDTDLGVTVFDHLDLVYRRIVEEVYCP